MQRVNIDLPKELWKKVGVQAAIEDIQKREIVIKALEQYLNRVKEEV
jgi:metal-responsive CopG/Arc/MetJ family transcriptional regulator